MRFLEDPGGYRPRARWDAKQSPDWTKSSVQTPGGSPTHFRLRSPSEPPGAPVRPPAGFGRPRFARKSLARALRAHFSVGHSPGCFLTTVYVFMMLEVTGRVVTVRAVKMIRSFYSGARGGRHFHGALFGGGGSAVFGRWWRRRRRRWR